MFYAALFWKEKGTGTAYRRVPSQEINAEKYRTAALMTITLIEILKAKMIGMFHEKKLLCNRDLY